MTIKTMTGVALAGVFSFCIGLSIVSEPLQASGRDPRGEYSGGRGGYDDYDPRYEDDDRSQGRRPPRGGPGAAPTRGGNQGGRSSPVSSCIALIHSAINDVGEVLGEGEPYGNDGYDERSRARDPRGPRGGGGYPPSGPQRRY